MTLHTRSAGTGHQERTHLGELLLEAAVDALQPKISEFIVNLAYGSAAMVAVTAKDPAFFSSL